jgi:hypothetical protein
VYGIVLFSVVIVLFVTVGIVLVDDTCCISIVSVVPVCISPGLWAQQVISEHGFGGMVV